MPNFWNIVDKVIAEADILLMVVDARMIEQTRNKEIEEKVAASAKVLITVINKADLKEKEELEPYKKKLHPCVFVSSLKFYGMTMLRRLILRYTQGKPVTVGVLGYPNTGKSSIINALKGKGSAGVSSQSGFTKGRQNIKVDNKIRVIDTPGVLAQTDDKTSDSLTITASRTRVKEPELAVFELLKLHRKDVLNYYGLEDEQQDEEELLEAIALKLNRKAPGGTPDTPTTARLILQDWQKGKITLSKH